MHTTRRHTGATSGPEPTGAAASTSDHRPTTDVMPVTTVTTVMTVIASISLIVSGLSLAAYALTAFVSPDPTVAVPSLLVAVAGVVGLRNRWFFLAGTVPIGAVVSIGSPIVAYDLARPAETAYFVGSAVSTVAACAALAFGVAAAVGHRRSLLLATVAFVVTTPIAFATVIGANPASADPSTAISEADRAAALDVEMIDVAFLADTSALRPGTVIHLRNSGDLPHDFTIAALDVAVFVPSGRSTHLRLPASVPDTFELICTVGDHLEQGMRIDLTRAD